MMPVESVQILVGVDFFLCMWYLVVGLDTAKERPMGYPTKVQLIRRKDSEQWYVNFPAAIAQAMEFARGEIVEWVIEDKALLLLRRRNAPPAAHKKGALD
jgi:hypothetical protein